MVDIYFVVALPHVGIAIIAPSVRDYMLMEMYQMSVIFTRLSVLSTQPLLIPWCPPMETTVAWLNMNESTSIFLGDSSLTCAIHVGCGLWSRAPMVAVKPEKEDGVRRTKWRIKSSLALYKVQMGGNDMTCMWEFLRA